MATVLYVLYILVCVLLILVVLLQPGKSGGMGVIGGGSGSTVFGARGAVGFLAKFTVWLAASFMVLSLFMARATIPESGFVDQTAKGAATPGTGEAPAPKGDEDKKADADKKAEEAKPAAKPADKKAEEVKPADAKAPAANKDDTAPK